MPDIKDAWPQSEEDLIIEFGWFFFPIKIVAVPGEKVKKIPLIKWKEGSSNSIDQIKWWRQKYDRMFADVSYTYFTFGIDCEKSGLFVIDDDCGKDPEATKTLLALELEWGPLPATFVSQTISLGRHFYFLGEGQSSVRRLGPGIDTRGEAGFVVSPLAPGYSILYYLPPVPAPEWALSSAGRPYKRERPAADPNYVYDTSMSITLAIQFLRTTMPAEIGQGGNNCIYKTAARVKDYGVSEDKNIELMLEHWYPRCDPNDREESLARIVGNAYVYGDSPPGVSNPETVFEVWEDPEGHKGYEAKKGKKPNPNRYKMLSSEDVDKFPPLKWRVKGIIPSRGMVQIYGPTKSGKSFLVFDMLAAIAEGRTWFDYKTLPCEVLYVCLEGEYGLQQRKQAWEKVNGHRLPGSFHMSAFQPLDLASEQDVLDMGASAPQGGVIVIDTQDCASSGSEENGSADMGRILAGAKLLAEEEKGLVILVAHTGKDISKGVRGWSGQAGRVDAALAVTRSGELRQWRSDKVKDGSDDKSGNFRLNIVEVGRDEDGKAITSCVIDLNVNHLLSLDKINNLSTKGGEAFEAAKMLSSTEIGGCFSRKKWKDQLKIQWQKKGPRTITNDFSSAVTELKKKSLITEINGLYQLSVVTALDTEE